MRTKQPNGFDWIENDDLLRDEGVIFGLSNSETDYKAEAIREYYKLKAEGVSAYIRNLVERAKHLRNDLEEKEGKLISHFAQIDQLTLPPERKTIYFLATFLRFTFYLVTIALNYWLVYDYLSHSEVIQFPIIITTGLYLLGALLLFNRKSFLFIDKKEQEEMPRNATKVFWVELLVPVITTLFILFLGFVENPLRLTIAYAFILPVLFYAAGKGFISLLPKLIEDWNYMQNSKKVKQVDKRRKAQYEKEIPEIEESIRALKDSIEKLNEEKYQKQHEINGIESACDAKIALFMSEYKLTRAASQRIPLDELNNL